MSWTTFHARISALMVSGGFNESETTFDVENLPASISDKSFSILSTAYGAGRHGVLNPTMKISVIFDLGNSSPDLYNEATVSGEWIIKNIGNFNDIIFTGSTSKFNKEENFLINEYTFNCFYTS